MEAEWHENGGRMGGGKGRTSNGVDAIEHFPVHLLPGGVGELGLDVLDHLDHGVFVSGDAVHAWRREGRGEGQAR